MPRPIVYNNLKTTSVTIEVELLNQAKVMGINISEVLRQSLIFMVGDPRQKELLHKFSKIPKFEIKRIRRFISYNPSCAKFWAGWLSKKYNTELTEQDFLDKFGGE